MRPNKNQYILMGSAFLGVAVASSLWLSPVIQRRARADTAAQQIGFKTAVDYREASDLTNRVGPMPKDISQQDEEMVWRLFQHGNDTQKSYAMAIMDGLAEKNRAKPDVINKVARFLAVAKNDPSPEFRLWSVRTALKMPPEKGQPIIASLTADPDPTVREKATVAISK